MTDPAIAALIDRLNPDLRESFEERAAIVEYDGLQPREHAEALALLYVLRSHPTALLGLTVMQVEIEGNERCALVTDPNTVQLRVTCKARRSPDDLTSIVSDRFAGIALLSPLQERSARR